MTKDEHKKIRALIHRIGLKYNLPDDVVKRIVESPYEFAYITLRQVKLDGIQSEEELKKHKTNFNFKALGKLYVNYPSLERREKQKKFINILNKKNKWKK
jgi:hypothetical protein